MDYANGLIYAIRSHLTDQIYIGSTTTSLAKRLYQHKTANKPCTSAEIIKYGDAYIELIENFPCQNKQELNRREGQHIRNTENCVNKNIPGRDQKESQSAYYLAHKAELLENKKQYHIKHRAERLKYQKQYYLAHRAEQLENQKQYRNNKKRGGIPTENGGQGACPLNQAAPSSEV